MAGAVLVLCGLSSIAYVGQNSEQYSAEHENLSQPQTKVKRGKGKVLVAYFSVPERDGVDAVAGASRMVAKDKVMGNTQYVASIISEATGGRLFEIRTTYTYPASHKALIDAAQKEADEKARPKLATHIKNLKDYDVVFVGFQIGYTTCRCPFIPSSMNTISRARPSSRSARTAEAASLVR